MLSLLTEPDSPRLTMNFRNQLSQRIGLRDIHEILFVTQGNNLRKQELYNLLFDPDELVAYQASWVFCHFTREENKWLFDKQDALINEVMACTHTGKRRQILHLLTRQPLSNPPRVDFLDFCLNRMMASKEPPAVQMLSMKLAYEQCRLIPELLQEFRATLDIMEPHLLPPSISSVRRNVLKAMQKGKSLQDY